MAIDKGAGYVELPPPSYLRTPRNEVVRSNRNALGNLFRFRINRKAGIDVKWAVITPAEKNLIMELTEGNSFQVGYFDTNTSKTKYGKFYLGNDAEVIPLKSFDGTDFPYYSVSLSMVEY